MGHGSSAVPGTQGGRWWWFFLLYILTLVFPLFANTGAESAMGDGDPSWLGQVILARDCAVNPKAPGLQRRHSRLAFFARLLGILTTPVKYTGIFG